MVTEKLINCERCGSNACSETNTEHQIFWLCFGCGFSSTNTLNRKASKKYKSKLPELHQDLEFKDKKGLYWYPTTLTLDNKSMVFAEGVSIKNWKWAAVKSIELTNEEKLKFKNETHKADMTTIKRFNEFDFIEALSYIGYFELV